MDPNAKPATICKKGHPRIWYTTRECPMCESVAYGKRISDKLSQATEKGKTWQRLAEKMKDAMLKCEADNERLYRLQDPEAHPPARRWVGGEIRDRVELWVLPPDDKTNDPEPL